MAEYPFRPNAETWRPSTDETEQEPQTRAETSTRDKLKRAGAILGLIGSIGGIPMAFSAERAHHPGRGRQRERAEMTADDLKQELFERSLEQRPANTLAEMERAREEATVAFERLEGETVDDRRDVIRLAIDAEGTRMFTDVGYAPILAALCGYETPNGLAIDTEQALLLYGQQISLSDSNFRRAAEAVIGPHSDATRRILTREIVNKPGGMAPPGSLIGLEPVRLELLQGKYDDDTIRDWHQGLYAETRSLVAWGLEAADYGDASPEEQREIERELGDAVGSLAELCAKQAQIGYAIAEGSSQNTDWLFNGDDTLGIASGVTELNQRLDSVYQQFADLDTYAGPVEDSVRGSSIAREVHESLQDDLEDLMLTRAQLEAKQLLGLGSGRADDWEAHASALRSDQLLTPPPEAPSQIAQR